MRLFANALADSEAVLKKDAAVYVAGRFASHGYTAIYTVAYRGLAREKLRFCHTFHRQRRCLQGVWARDSENSTVARGV